MYKTVDGSMGERRSFVITAGLRVGYGENAMTYPVEVAIQASVDWMKARAAAGKPFLTGTISAGEVVYAWPTGPGKAEGGHEPTAVFSGEVSPLYGKDLTAVQIMNMLNELAAHLGVSLGQTRVYVAYGKWTWILQAEDTETPTGESV